MIRFGDAQDFRGYLRAIETGWKSGFGMQDEPRDCPYPKMTREWELWQKFRGMAIDCATAVS